MKRKLLFIILTVLGTGLLILGIKLGMLAVIHGFASQI
jgi:hypothetical protein